jgi:hypothetical protein
MNDQDPNGEGAENPTGAELPVGNAPPQPEPVGDTAPATPETPAPPAASGPPDPAEPQIAAIKKRWELAIGGVTWLATVLAPALTFNIVLSLNSDSGIQFKAFLLIITTVIFLLGWTQLNRIPIAALIGVLVLAVGSFVAYSLLKDVWTCRYYPAVNPDRFLMGEVLLDNARTFLVQEGLLRAPCEAVMENWGGDAEQIWERGGLIKRFLILFGLYAFAFQSLALLIVAAVRRSLSR